MHEAHEQLYIVGNTTTFTDQNGVEQVGQVVAIGFGFDGKRYISILNEKGLYMKVDDAIPVEKPD